MDMLPKRVSRVWVGGQHTRILYLIMTKPIASPVMIHTTPAIGLISSPVFHVFSFPATVSNFKTPFSGMAFGIFIKYEQWVILNTC